VIGGYGQQGDDRLCGITVATGRRSQAVADLDAAVIWLALEADSPDGPPVGQAGDPVVAERPLLSLRGGRAKEGPHGANVTLKWEIIGPGVGRSRTPRDDAFGLSDIDSVQLEARSSNVGHGVSEVAAVAEQPDAGHEWGCWLRMANHPTTQPSPARMSVAKEKTTVVLFSDLFHNLWRLPLQQQAMSIFRYGHPA